MKKASALCMIITFVLFFGAKNISSFEHREYSKNNPLYSAYVKIKPGMTVDSVIKLVESPYNELTGYLLLEHDRDGSVFWHWSKPGYEEEVIAPTAFLTIEYAAEEGIRTVCKKKYLYSADKILITLEEEIRKEEQINERKAKTEE